MIQHTKYARSSRGYSITEVPAGLWLLFCGIFFPLLIFGSMTYRAILAQNAARDATVKAAKAKNFTEAKQTAQDQYAEHVKALTGINGTYKLEIVIKPLSNGNPTVQSNVLTQAQVNPAQNMYFIRGTLDAEVDPIVRFQLPLLPNATVPGLTGPYPIKSEQEFYFENPYGLTK